MSPAAPATALRTRWTAHLRVYESAQILVPGIVGMLAAGTLPSWPRALLYLVTYAAHVLSVYSYNDYCDHESDSDNPRKSVEPPTSRRRLASQTVLLLTLFLIGAAVLRSRAGVLLLVAQLVCMAYSHPRIRLKGRLLGGELAHFVAGALYFASGVSMVDVALKPHALGALTFGLLYVSGGTVNEILDFEPDRRARLSHLVVRIGRRRGLQLVQLLHYVCMLLLALHWPTTPMIVAILVAAASYAAATRGLSGRAGSERELLRFRRHYRVIFAALLLVLCTSRAAEIVRGETTAGQKTGEADVARVER